MKNIRWQMICGLLCLAGISSSRAQVSFAPIHIRVNPGQNFLVPNELCFDAPPRGRTVYTNMISLQLYDVFYGDKVQIQTVGDFAVGQLDSSVVGGIKYGPEQPQPMLGMFVFTYAFALGGSDCIDISKTGIQTDLPQYSTPPWQGPNGAVPTDIPKDFLIPPAGVTTCFPAGAIWLAVGSADASNRFTRDANSDFGIVITPLEKIRFDPHTVYSIVLSSTNIQVGQTFTATVVLTNTGNIAARNFTPRELSSVPATSPLRLISGPTASLTTVQPGQAVTIQCIYQAVRTNLTYVQFSPYYTFCDGSLGPAGSWFSPIFKVTESPLATSVTASPHRVGAGDPIQVVVTAQNNSSDTLTNVQISGSITVAGKGAVAAPIVVPPQVAATLGGRQFASFTNLFTATNYGPVQFTATTTGTGPNGIVPGSTDTSSPVLIAPKGDLLIKRNAEPANQYAGAGIFQTIPIPPQIKTNFVVNTGDISTFQVQIQNNDPIAQTFTLNLDSGGNPVWNQTFLLSGTDVTAQLEAPNGLTLPIMAPNTSLVLTVSMQDTNASPGDVNGVVITLGLASDPTLTLDAVETVTQVIPDGDLLIKRDAEPASLYAGQNIFQTVPAYPQIETNLVALNQGSQFQVQVLNTSTQAQSFTLLATPSGNSGWMRSYFLGTQSMTSQLEAPGGANLPQLAPSSSLTLDVLMRATNAPPGDLQRIDFTLALASHATVKLDTVEAVSQLRPPDLAVVSMAWDTTNSGLNFVYTNRGGALTNATLAQVYWASGPTTNDIISSLPPIYTAHIPAGFSGQASNQVTEAHFNQPPTNSTYVQVLLDPDNLIPETTKTNNALFLRLIFRHVVLVMMENRSFDHFLGWLHGADGMQGRRSYTNEAGKSFPQWHLPYFQGCGCDLPDQSFGATKQYDGGACDGWLLANPQNTFTIGYYTQSDLDFFGQIAPNWTVCDHYFSALMAETQPNRIYQHAAQTSILVNNPGAAVFTNMLTLPTIWDRLAATNIFARYYYAGLPVAGSVLSLWGPGPLGPYNSISYQIPQFYQDLANGTLPAVSFVDPDFTSVRDAFHLGDTTGNDDHPHSDVRNGEVFLAGIYNAIIKSPTWASTVLIINFDEWGGFYDHVPPPLVAIEPAERALGNDGRLGFRVPCIVISPWSHRGVVKNEQFDHCSVLKLIENRWNLEALTVRDANANDLADVLDLDHPDFSAPNTISVRPGPFGQPCLQLQITQQPGGGAILNWDASCINVIIQEAFNPHGPWIDQPGILAPPYFITPAQVTQSFQGFWRFEVVQ